MDPLHRLRLGLILAGLGVLITPLAVLPELIGFSRSIGGSILAGFALIGLGLVAAGIRLPRTLRSDREPGGFLFFLPAFGAVLLVVFTWTWPALYVLGLLIIAVGTLVFGFAASTWGDGESERKVRHLRLGSLAVLIGAAVWATWYLMVFTSYRQVTNQEIVKWESGSLLFAAGMFLSRSGFRRELIAPAAPDESDLDTTGSSPEERFLDGDEPEVLDHERFEEYEELHRATGHEEWPAQPIVPATESEPNTGEPSTFGGETTAVKQATNQEWTAEEMLLGKGEPPVDLEYANQVDHEELAWQEWTARRARSSNGKPLTGWETDARLG